ncbi:hypothetical protein [Tenacibaculum finnmarkense]|uniref:hypothetical protein n=1 Tax=Tenacibaculum finnmarkense TaxID=2781243 RepID=UPI001E316F5F|nr:hypothetical protein [Tenacibaculum finnmarkense]MCD8445678.1 hypothetical protein [Tenacibaculum finnmarkense genomovar ulcerans]
MSYESTVYRILIASPSDVDEEREVVSRIIQDWNDLNSFNKKIVLLPVRWETHSSPTFGVRPQEAINKQLVDDCDLLVGFFWTKIGTPTGEEIGGTVEEIKRVSKAGKPVMLYFSKRGKDPSLIDLEQLQSLNKFKSEVYKTALVENFNSIVEFRDKLSRQLEMKIRELQERKDGNKNLITFSFVDETTGNLTTDSKELSLERIDLPDKKVEELIKKDERLKNNKKAFQSALYSYLNKKNNIPVVFGLKNNVDRIFSNINLELRLKSSKKDSLNVRTYGTSQNNRSIYRLSNLVSTEDFENFRNILNDNEVQISPDSWEFKMNSFTLLPEKAKVIEPILLLFPTSSMKIKFSLHLFSENILQSIESHCELKINFKQRELSNEEIEEVIKKVPEYDDIPF